MTKEQQLTKALGNLVAKIEQVEKNPIIVSALSFPHGGQYSIPSWAAEMNEAREALGEDYVNFLITGDKSSVVISSHETEEEDIFAGDRL